MKILARFNVLLAAVLGMALGFGSVASADVYYGANVNGNQTVLPGALVSAGGAAPVLSGCATLSAKVLGPTAGKFVTSGTSCNLVVTFATAAPNGWFCVAVDLTTAASVVSQASSTTTTATFAGTTVAADVVQFACIGY